ncbi:MAG: TonB-dependent receptor [Woeseiaceae bacterium]|nr:TonB-dependent receptor [Woeseiaceae bacterium]
MAADGNDAEDAATILDEIVVVANKSERSIRDIAANVTVFSREELRADLSTTVADIFRYSPGIDYEASGSRFGTEGINIRGIGGNRVAMLVDGVPLSDQFDIGNFSNATRDFINAGLVERVEVLHGPASALYGSSAIGGVVAVRTPDPADIVRDGAGGDITAHWRGADESSHGTGLFAIGDASLGVLLGGSLRSGHELESAAVDEHLDLRSYERLSGLLKFVVEDAMGSLWRFGVIHQHVDVRSDINSKLGVGRFRSTTALEGDDAYTMSLVNLEYEFGSPDAWVDAGVLRAYAQSAEVSQQSLDERGLASTPVSIDRFFSFDQQIQGAELNLQKSLGDVSNAHQLGFGLEYRERETTEYRDGLSTNMLDGSATRVILGEEFPLRDFPISTTREWGAYVEDAYSLGHWSLIAAVRADRYELSPSSDPMYAEDFPFAELVSISESDLSPKLGLIYRLTPQTDIYLQYAHGFRAPPYEDANIGLEIPVFNVRAIPNPDLRSESSDGIDLGLRWQGVEKGARLSIFRTRYSDFIESKVRLGIDPVSGRLLFQSQNLSEAIIEGLEAGGHLQQQSDVGEFRIDASLYLARGENRDNGQPLNSVGPAQAVVGTSWLATDGRHSLRLQTTMTEAWDDRDESAGELFEPAGHTVFDFYYTRRFGDTTTLRVGVLNLLDRVYWNWSDVRGLAPSDPVLPFLAQPGRHFSLSINLSWQ